MAALEPVPESGEAPTSASASAPEPASESEPDTGDGAEREVVVGALGAALAPRDAFRASREGTPLVHLRSDVEPFRLTGADRADFLHGQISAPVRGRGAGAYEPALLLDHRGHAHAQLAVAVRERDLYLAVYGGAGAWAASELERHIVFDQVEIESLSGTLVTLDLHASDAALARLGWERPAAGTWRSAALGDAELLLHPALGAAPDAVAVHALRRDLPRLAEALAAIEARPLAPGAATALRVAAGVPLAPLDAGAGVLPQEAGLEPLVSYRKGCYLGQEIMARIEARGKLKRALGAVRLEAPEGGDSEAPPEPGTELRAAGRVVGRLGSAARLPGMGWTALAVLRDDLDPDAELTAGGWHAAPTDLPPLAPEGASG